MWVDVQQWDGDGESGKIAGLLLNQPAICTYLKLGQMLHLMERDVFDWLRVTPGGRQVGNFTAEALD